MTDPTQLTSAERLERLLSLVSTRAAQKASGKASSMTADLEQYRQDVLEQYRQDVMDIDEVNAHENRDVIRQRIEVLRTAVNQVRAAIIDIERMLLEPRMLDELLRAGERAHDSGQTALELDTEKPARGGRGKRGGTDS